MTIKVMIYGFIASTALLATGCSGFTMKQYQGLNVEQHFVLQKNLTIAPGSTRVFIQKGQSMGGSGFNHSEQHCRLEVKNLSDRKQVIQPDKFQITSIQIDEEMIAKIAHKPVQFALNNYAQIQTDVPLQTTYLTLAGSSQERVETMDLIHLNLLSNQQNNVMRLTCAGSLSNGDMADAPRSYRPNLEQINKILGNIGHIE